jgi:glycosyltransferase involved in cell wall biosynthesis
MPDRPVKSLHVITGLWKHTGGPSESVPALCAALRRRGDQVTLATLDGDMATAVGAAEAAGVRVQRFAPTLRHTIWYSRPLAAAMPRLVAGHDIVHVHAMWQWPGWAAATEAHRADKPLVLSPRGSVLPERLKKSAVKKWIAAHVRDRPLMATAAAVHATAPAEAAAVRRFGYLGPVAVIPNGIAVPPEPDVAARAAARRWLDSRHPKLAGRRILLFMSRIEPTKGVSTLARAWSELAARFPDWALLIAGPDERGYGDEVARLVAAGGAADQTIMAGPLYDHDRERAYLSASLFILPTKSENFGMVIAEALARGVPAITTRGAPWQAIEAEGCGWWVDSDLAGIRGALGDALAQPPERLAAMGRRGRAWVAAEYSWDRVAAEMADLYAWLLRGDRRPPCVQTVP